MIREYHNHKLQTTPTQTENPLNRTLILEPPIERTIIGRPGWWDWPREESVVLPEMNYTIPSDGIIDILIDIPSEVTRVSIEVGHYINIYTNVD